MALMSYKVKHEGDADDDDDKDDDSAEPLLYMCILAQLKRIGIVLTNIPMTDSISGI